MSETSHGNASPQNSQPQSGDPKKAFNSADKQAQAEREMLLALNAEDAGGTADSETGRCAQGESVTVRPVEMDPLKPITAGVAEPNVNLELILDIPVELKVEIGSSRLTIREVLNLAPGSIVELDRTAGSPADLIVNGTLVGQGDIVVVDESYGIRISRLVDPQERLNSL